MSKYRQAEQPRTKRRGQSGTQGAFQLKGTEIRSETPAPPTTIDDAAKEKEVPKAVHTAMKTQKAAQSKKVVILPLILASDRN